MNRKLVMIFELRNERNHTIEASEHLLAEEPHNNLNARELSRVLKFIDYENELAALLKTR